jgi:transposase
VSTKAGQLHSDDGLSAEDIVLGYKQLAAVECVFRDLKHRVDIRPVYHRLADRIRAHVLLCWLALLHRERDRGDLV